MSTRSRQSVICYVGGHSSPPLHKPHQRKVQPSDAVAPVFVETHESVESEGIRCVKGYSIVALTGTDAIPLDTSERPYKGLPVLR